MRSRADLTLQRFNGSSCAKRMNLSDLANLGQIIGALAVVISLVYSRIKFSKTLVQKIVERNDEDRQFHRWN